MPTTKRPDSSHGKSPIPATASKAAADGPPVRLKTDEEVQAYLAAHLKPVRYGPKGQPIYAHDDIAKLNVIIRPGV